MRRNTIRTTLVVIFITTCTLGPSASAQEQGATFTTFDVPGAGTGFEQGTYPLSINPAAAITGGTPTPAA